MKSRVGLITSPRKNYRMKNCISTVLFVSAVMSGVGSSQTASRRPITPNEAHELVYTMLDATGSTKIYLRLGRAF